ncbi:hypothetical protein [Amycolatopsis sp. NPDC051102]|uniref:hypothetical protein n=1 Tax=Amycolatopsis sp. NPDC051102 TaxID=3155163 RepID=UPI0034376108
MGRHYRDEEPVPHPQDRTPRVPAEGRSEASGAFRTPGRSSISDAFGIAGRAARDSSGSAFFTEGAEAPGFPPEHGGPRPAGRRGEASGSYPVAGPGQPARAPRRGETSGAYPVPAEPTATRAPRRGEASGVHPVPGHGEPARGGRRGEASGSYPVAGRTEVPGITRRGEASGAYASADPATRTGRRGEASGSYPVATRTDVPGRAETTGARTEVPGTAYATAGADTATRAGHRGPSAVTSAEVTTAYPAIGPEAPARSGRRGKRTARPPESPAERTEVITRQDDVPGARTLDRDDDTPGDAAGDTVALRTPERSDSTGPQRAGRGDSTGPNRAGRSEGTGSHRVLGKGDATGSHRIVGKKAPRRRIATWPIACMVLAALIGLGIVGWNWADNELNSRAEAQAASCDGGTAQMRIVVTPSVQKPITAAADRWNQAATVVHGQCVHIKIEAKPSAQVLDALVGRSNLDSIGGLPAAWLPESSYWVSELTTKKPEMIGSPAQSVANARSADYPFIGLAGSGIDDTALRAAQTFREYLEQPAQQADFVAAGIKSA